MERSTIDTIVEDLSKMYRSSTDIAAKTKYGNAWCPTLPINEGTLLKSKESRQALPRGSKCLFFAATFLLLFLYIRGNQMLYALLN